MATLGRYRGALWLLTAVMVLVAGVFIWLTVDRIRSDDPGLDELATATVLPEPIPAPTVSLPDTAGNPVPLVDTEEGTLNVVYFGYTNCPDICPLTFTALAAGMRQMDPEDAARVRVVFVAVDPERDDPESVERWVSHHSEDFIGVIPTLATTDAVLDEMGYAPIDTRPTPGAGGYAVSHPVALFVFTDDGEAHAIFTMDSPPEQIAHDLTLLLDGWPPPGVDS